MPKPSLFELSLYAFMVVLIIFNYERKNYPIVALITLMFIKELVDLKKRG